METSPRSTASPSLPGSMPGEAFLAALAEGLPDLDTGRFPVVVAVSGGADSVAMLIGLTRLGVSNLVVAHAEHDMRPEAHEDREFVGRLAARLGLRSVWRRIAVRKRGDEAAGEGLEGRARRLRYAFLAEVAHEVGARYVLVAHTVDDQAETILHRILRGTGIAGLAGMRRVRALADGVALARPLLGIPRFVGREFLRHAAEEWHEDATNADIARARNFLRHDILSRCVTGPYPSAVASIARLGSQAATLADAITSATGHLLDLHGTRQADGSVIIQTRDLAGLDRHLLAEVFVALWRREGWPQRDMTACHYQALAEFAAGLGQTSSLDMPGRIRIRYGDGTLVLEPPATCPTRPVCSPRSPQNRAGSQGRSRPSSPG